MKARKKKLKQKQRADELTDSQDTAARKEKIDNDNEESGQQEDDEAEDLLRGDLSSLSDEERLKRIRTMTKRTFFSDNFFECFVEIIKEGELLYKVLNSILIRFFMLPSLLLLMLRVIIVFLTYCSPLLLDNLISQMQRKEQIDESAGTDAAKGSSRSSSDDYFLKDYQRNMLILSLCILAAYFFNAIVREEYESRKEKLSRELETFLAFGLYEKLLRKQNVEEKQEKPGLAKDSPNLQNLVFYDIPKVVEGVQMMFEAVGISFELAVGTYFLYNLIKGAIVYGVGVIVGISLANIALASLAQYFGFKIVKYKDERLSLTQDVVSGIKSIKYLNWETIFEFRINYFRDREFRYTKYIRYVDALVNFFWRSLSFSLMYVFLKSASESKGINLYSSLVLFNLFVNPVTSLPWVFGSAFGTIFSFNRIRSFFNGEEIALDEEKKKPPAPEGAKKPALSKSLNFPEEGYVWPQQKDESDEAKGFTLKQPSFSLLRGALVMIMGKCGSGKSAFLNALLNEMEPERKSRAAFRASSLRPQSEKEVRFNKNEERVAFVDQAVWLENKSIKENILFKNQELNPKYYDECLEACELKPDLSSLEGGDSYVVGLNGTNLSGGQRQRVALARALYQNADVYVFDDIFSSVDENVANKIFQKAIIDILKASEKTVFMSLSQDRFLVQATHVLNISDGQMKLLPRPSIERNLLNIKKEIKESKVSASGSRPGTGKESSLRVNRSRRPETAAILKDLMSQDSLVEEYRNPINEDSVTFYIFAMGWLAFVLIAIVSISQQGVKNFIEIWLNNSLNVDSGAEVLKSADFNRRLSLLTLIFALVTLLRGFFYAFGIIRAARSIFRLLLNRVMLAPMKLFDSYNIGDILNRFNMDTAIIDVELPETVNYVLQVTLTSVGIFLTLIYEIPLIILILSIFLKFLANIHRFHRTVSKKVKRMVDRKRSDLISFIFESISGTKTIRAFSREKEFKEEFIDKFQDYSTISTSESFVVRMIKLKISLANVGVILLLVSFLLVLLYFDIPPHSSSIGMAICCTIMLSKNLEDSILSTVGLEKHFMSLERVGELINFKPAFQVKEPSERKPMAASSSAVDKQAEKLRRNSVVISFQNVWLSYEDSEKPKSFALKNITLNIEKNTKIAICGRTGSGKSSVLNCILNMYPMVKGKVLLNGNNTQFMTKEALANKISVIPQFGFLFKGTLRENLDPEYRFKNEAIESFLNDCQFNILDFSLSGEPTNPAPPGSSCLEKWIESNGSNLSAGQKQLVNFIQSLLRKRDVVILDEATSNLDRETDALLMKLLFKLVQDKTLVMVSHKLENLKEFDCIYVLENGEIAERGTYEQLTDNRNSYFNKLRSREKQAK